MGSKNNPGSFDCYATARDDEPMFVLLGRDPMAGHFVRAWADWRERRGEDPAKVAEARRCADAIDAWARSLGKVPIALEPSNDGLKREMRSYAESLDNIREALGQEQTHHLVMAGDIEELVKTVELCASDGGCRAMTVLQSLREKAKTP